ncbi:hypothetical protein, partial [Streptomyces sp. NPDC005143]
EVTGVDYIEVPGVREKCTSRGTAAGPGGAAGVSTTVGSWTGQGATSVRSSWNDRGAGTVGGVATAIPPASPLPGAAR